MFHKQFLSCKLGGLTEMYCRKFCMCNIVCLYVKYGRNRFAGLLRAKVQKGFHLVLSVSRGVWADILHQKWIQIWGHDVGLTESDMQLEFY